MWSSSRKRKAAEDGDDQEEAAKPKQRWVRKDGVSGDNEKVGKKAKGGKTATLKSPAKAKKAKKPDFMESTRSKTTTPEPAVMEELPEAEADENGAASAAIAKMSD